MAGGPGNDFQPHTNTHILMEKLPIYNLLQL